EAAGIGALLAQLERLKAKLAAEGLFEAARKQPIPAMPSVVGVITSPTGAVIRDILHRIRDRWPCRVIVWPVVVQGDSAAALVAGYSARMHRCGGRMVEDRRTRIDVAQRGLTRVQDLVRLAEQRFDIVSGRLGAGLARNAAVHERDLVRVASRLSPLLLQRPQ